MIWPYVARLMVLAAGIRCALFGAWVLVVAFALILALVIACEAPTPTDR